MAPLDPNPALSMEEFCVRDSSGRQSRKQRAAVERVGDRTETPRSRTDAAACGTDYERIARPPAF